MEQRQKIVIFGMVCCCICMCLLFVILVLDPGNFCLIESISHGECDKQNRDMEDNKTNTTPTTTTDQEQSNPPISPSASSQQSTSDPTASPKCAQFKKADELAYIWDDAGTDADKDFRTSRAKKDGDWYPIGDCGNDTCSKPQYLIRSVYGKHPVGFEKVWDDKGSGGWKDYSLWKPIAPVGYKCVGHVGNSHHNNEPEKESIMCVPSCAVEKGSSKGSVWTDSGSGANQDAHINTSHDGYIHQARYSEPEYWSIKKEYKL